MARMPDSHPDAGSSSPFHRGDDEEQRQPSIPRGKRSIASQTSRPDRRKRGKHTSSFRSDEAHYGGSPVLRPLTPLTRPAYSAVTENQSRGSRNSLEHHACHHQSGSPGPSRVPPRAPTPPPPPVADRLPRDRRSGHNFTSIGSWCDNNPTPPRTRRPEHITLSESRNDGMISPSPEPETYGSSNESSFMASSYQFDYAGEDDDDRISNSACYITMVDRYNAARQSAAEEHINATRRAAGRR